MIVKGQVNEVTGSPHDNATDPRFSVVGVGGAGCNVVSSLYDREVQGLELVAINIDEESLSRTHADVKVLLSPPSQAGSGPASAELAAEAARESLERVLSADVLFLVCGLGGATGTGAAPVIASIASECGAVIITIAVTPFAAEGRSEIATEGLVRLKEMSHAVLVVDNNNLLTFEDLGFNEGMVVINKMVEALIQGVVEQLTSPFLSSLAEEVQTVAREAIGQETESIGFEVAAPSGVEAAPEYKPVGFDDKGFIGFA